MGWGRHLRPEVVDCIVFWTKNPAPLLGKLDRLKEYNYYFQFTVNPYGKELETHLPPLSRRLDTFKRLSDKIGREKVIWRYDPVLTNREYTVAFHQEKFAAIAGILKDYTEKCMLGFIDHYRHILPAVSKHAILPLQPEEIEEMAVSFRKTVARLYAEFSGKKDWFFNVWQPDFVTDEETGRKMPFFEVSEERLATDPECWTLKPNEEWHGFGNVEPGYCMLDPIKVSVVTPGVLPNAGLADWGIPAAVVTAYLDNKGIIVEKTTDFTILFLFSLGVTNGKWGTLLNALFDFKQDYDNNEPLSRVLPKIVKENGQAYRDMGLKDLCDKMFAAMKELKTTQALSEAFSILPRPDMSPVQAYENLVHNNVVSLSIDDMADKTVATGVVPYPPGIPLLMPGENAGAADGPILGYLKALQAFDRRFPGFGHDTHGVEVKDGTYYILCIKQ